MKLLQSIPALLAALALAGAAATAWPVAAQTEAGCPIEVPAGAPPQVTLRAYREALDLADEESLTACAGSPSRPVRAGVAANWRTPAATLGQLAGDGEAEIRGAVARNSHVPLETLRTLAGDAHAGVRMAAASNPWLPVDLVRAFLPQAAASFGEPLAAGPSDNAQIAFGLARNPASTPSMLTLLATHPQYNVREQVAANDFAPSEVLDALAADPMEYVSRQAVSTRARQGAAALPEACTFAGPFQAIHERIPAITGECTQNERPLPNGNTMQRTTNGYLLWHWRVGVTTFAGPDGTWVLSPDGLQGPAGAPS